MKKQITLLCFVLLFINLSFGQNKNTLPNYLKAENSNFVVNIITMVDIGVHKHRNYIDVPSFKTVNRISPDEFQNVDEGLFNTLAFMINKEFEKIGMLPKGFLNINLNDMENAEFMKNRSEQFKKIMPGFVVNIVCNDWDKEKKAFTKNKLELSDVKPISFSISKTGETDPSKVFIINKSNLSLGTAFEELSKMISEQSDSYFIKNMEIDKEIYSTPDFDPVIIDKMLKENESVENFPQEKELQENEILVVSYGLKDGMFYKQCLEYLEKMYPYKYKLIGMEDYKNYLSKGYKYILNAKYYLVEKNTANMTSQKTQNLYMFYYVIKDLNSLNVYYCDSKSNASESPSIGLKRTLEKMKEHYKWTK